MGRTLSPVGLVKHVLQTLKIEQSLKMASCKGVKYARGGRLHKAQYAPGPGTLITHDRNRESSAERNTST